MRRPTRLYLIIMALLIVMGLPARMVRGALPDWYGSYFGDYLWAMLIFFGFALLLRNKRTWVVVGIALATTYIIEITQLFHPAWLDQLRTYKIIALIIGFEFLWSDIAAYTFGIISGAFIELILMRRHAQQHVSR